MRVFGEPIAAAKQAEIVREAEKLYGLSATRRLVNASAFAMDLAGDPVVVHEADVRWPDGRVRVAKTMPEVRPPFEWVMEITSNVDEVDYFKHYLVRDGDIVLAQRRVLTPIDEVEAAIILNDLAQAVRAL